MVVWVCTALATAGWQHLLPVLFPVEWMVARLRSTPDAFPVQWWITNLGFGTIAVAGFMLMRRTSSRLTDADLIALIFWALLLGSEFFGTPAFLFGGDRHLEVFMGAALCGAAVYLFQLAKRFWPGRGG